jgi:hypothetical protein
MTTTPRAAMRQIKYELLDNGGPFVKTRYCQAHHLRDDHFDARYARGTSASYNLWRTP